MVEDMRVGKMMEEGFKLPAEPLRAMTVAGISWMEVALMTTSRLILAVDLPSLSICRIASMPAGVLAPPIPSIFDAIFKDNHLYASSLSPLKSRLITGRNILDNPASKRVFSIILSTDNHTEYMASSLTHNWIAPSAPSIIAGNNPEGFVTSRVTQDVKRRTTKTKFIQYFTHNTLLICFLVDKNALCEYNISH
jgi:hypothetical protein